MKKFFTIWLIALLISVSCTLQVSAQERKANHNQNFSPDNESEQNHQLPDKMSVDEKADFLKQKKENRSGISEKNSIDNSQNEREKKLNAIREKENLKRTNYDEYVRLYIGENKKSNSISEISRDEYESMPAYKKQHIQDNPDKYKIVNRKQGGNQ